MTDDERNKAAARRAVQILEDTLKRTDSAQVELLAFALVLSSLTMRLHRTGKYLEPTAEDCIEQGNRLMEWLVEDIERRAADIARSN